MDLRIISICLFTVCFTPSNFAAGDASEIRPRIYEIERAPAAPVIDGDWNDAAWQDAAIATDFVQLRPIENGVPSLRTEVKFIYDDGALYIAAYCYDDHPDSILTQLGNRDDGLNADFIRVSIDPYDQQQDNTSFKLYASGVQSDWRKSDASFNAVWESAVQIQEDGWSAEIRIPYSAIRFPRKDDQQWTMQIKRHIRRYREDVIWSPIDRDDSNYMNYWGKLRGFRNIDPPIRLSITPFINSQIGSKPNDDGEGQDFTWLLSGGADLKIGLNESFTFDMTLLPDFSQVQSDDVVNNLSAFETVFDEQRPFFQEGTELFDKGNLFYTRRIGGPVHDGDAVYDEVDEEAGEEIIDNPEKSRLVNAFKISGRTKKGAGIGVFNAIETRSYARISDTENAVRRVQTDPLTNYNILVLERHFRNTRSIYAINTNVARSDGYERANVLGGGFSYNTKSNNYNFRGTFGYSIINDNSDSTDRKTGYEATFDFDRVTGKWRYGYGFEIVSEDYDINDLGLNFFTNYLENLVTANYNINDPFWKLLELYTSVSLMVQQRLETGEVTEMRIRTELWGTFIKSYLNMWGGIQMNPYGTKDYYETRVEDRYFRDVSWGNFFLGASTDYRKKFSIDVEMWHTMSKGYGGMYNFGYWFRPIYRINDHLTLDYRFNITKRNRNIGFADFDENDEPIFGRRDRIDYTNTFSGNYIFRNNLSLGMRARHYWSRVDYSKYYSLGEKGEMVPTLYTDPHQENDINFNTFNIDLLFNWEFAPGSTLSVSYKNEVFSSTNDLSGNIFENLSDAFGEPQSNIVSIRLLYYLDYVNVRSWIQRKRDSKNRAALYSKPLPGQFM
jgi:hypothetical protein